MQYRTMPKSKDKLSVLGFGCMRLASEGEISLRSAIDVETAKRQIVHAIENGVNYLDTAYPYHRGDSERFLGEHILKDYRDKVYIATKLPCFSISKKEKIEEIFNKQLEKLQVDVIDYYLLHALDGGMWGKMKRLGIIDFMDRIKHEGKIRHMGFSFHGSHEDFKRVADEYDWDFAQVQYNILDENYQAGTEGIRYAASKNMGIIVMEPMRGGSLVGKMPESVVEVYRSAPIQKSPADWAFSWIYDHPEVTVVLSGMNEDKHIEENIAIASRAKANAMNDMEKQIIHQAKGAFNSALTIGCTGCKYCLPCPEGINIPDALKNLNNSHMFNKREAWMYHVAYNGVQTPDGKPHWAGSCVGCGVCEERCPQHLPIRDGLKQAAGELEGPVAKVLAAVMRRFFGR